MHGDWTRTLRWVAIALVTALVVLLVTFLAVIGIRPEHASQGTARRELPDGGPRSRRLSDIHHL